MPRTAGLGIFLLDPTAELKCYIKAQVKEISSVIMVEAAALDLASRICSRLGTNEVTFLTNNQALANFFRGTDHEMPPQWDIKPYTSLTQYQGAAGKFTKFKEIQTLQRIH